jgi:hypothetical protein
MDAILQAQNRPEGPVLCFLSVQNEAEVRPAFRA